MKLTTEQTQALTALAEALEACHKLQINVIGRPDNNVSLLVSGQNRVLNHTLTHKGVRGVL